MRSFRPKAVLLLALATMLSSTSVAADYSQYVDEMVEREKEIQENREEIVGEFSLKKELSEEALSLANDVMSESMKSYRDATKDVRKSFGIEIPAEIRAVNPDKEWVSILVSRSLGDSALERIMASVEGFDVPVRFVFQGIPENTTINDSMRDFATWSRELPSTPEAAINPVLFTDNNVTSVPRMIWMNAGEPVASVDGITNPAWLKNQIDLGERGYLGVRGPVEEISERNLIAVMKEKMGEIDLMAKKQESIDTYFERTEFIYLDEAKEDRTRYLDPTVVVQKPLKDGNGKIVVPAGSTFNPLALRPFTLRLVVFNPNRDEEVQWLANLPSNDQRQDVYIASELDGPNGWDQLQDVQDLIDDNVFLLKTDVWQRFDIEKTPSVVTSEGLMFRIDEFNVEQEKPESSGADQKGKGAL